MVIDCSAIPPALLESELFGHERGAFTGAAARHVGAFEAAHGWTLFLDEIGELPPDLQPKLLRVLENREIRRVGSTVAQPVDIRIIAATNRNLCASVNAGQFRPDLYFRLAVLWVVLPALRQRPDDIPALVDEILGTLDVTDEQRRTLLQPRFLAHLRRASWPGNVGERRNSPQPSAWPTSSLRRRDAS
jgi:two-component system response regulator GlrR